MANDIKDLSKYLKQVESTIYNSRYTEDLGKEAAGIIYRRTKSGIGVNTEGNRPEQTRKKTLKPLSARYIERRQKTGVRGKFGSPAESNLTYTGQMLESITVNATDRSFDLEIPSTRRDDGKTNKEVAGYVRKGGRPFFALVQDEVAILEKTVRDTVRSLLRKIF